MVYETVDGPFEGDSRERGGLTEDAETGREAMVVPTGFEPVFEP